jgi:hypothetical protein
MRGERSLGRERRLDGVPCPPERDEERIPLRVYLLPPGVLESLAQEPLMVGEHLHVALAELLHQGRRALDVRKEEGDRTARQVGHCRTSSVPRTYSCRPAAV